ncbi:MAG: pseudouridine synthase [Bacteroidota bacterium]
MFSNKHPRLQKKSPRVTLARALSKFGASSRAQGRMLVVSGKVAVNGVVIRNPDYWVDPKTERISLEGKVLKKQQFVYLALNKPAGYVTTRSDEKGRKTVYDLLPPEFRSLIPVGRLDLETTGLLLFTNDTQFGEKLTSPQSHIPKIYRVNTGTPLEAEDRMAMEKGMTIENMLRLRPATVRVNRADPLMCDVTIDEGKNRQVRKMFEELGYTVKALHRVSIGAVKLGSLERGKVRLLTQDEVRPFISQPKAP